MVRIKHRYLLVNILYPGPDDARRDAVKVSEDTPWSIRIRQPTTDKMNAKILVGMIRKEVEELFGDYGSGMIAGSLVVKYFSTATSTAIIRVARAHYRMVWAALSFATSLPTGQACVLQVVRVSGTIKKSEEEAIRRARWSILCAQASRVTTTNKDLVDVRMFAGIEDQDDE